MSASTPVTIVLTRAAGGSAALPTRLRELGLEVSECPLIRIDPLVGPVIDLANYDWVVLTSARAVEPLLARARGALPRVAVIGPGTADALRERGFEPSLVACRSTQEGLVAELPRDAGRVLFAGAENARSVIVRELRADFVPLYRTVEIVPDDFPTGDLVVLSSASAARSLARLGRDPPCVSIGPVTTAEAHRVGLRVVREATTPGLDGLVEAVKLAASTVDSSRS